MILIKYNNNNFFKCNFDFSRHAKRSNTGGRRIGRARMTRGMDVPYTHWTRCIQISARALVKKAQEPGIKLQKADFFRNNTWTSPQTNSEEAPKIPLVHFFNSRWPPPCNVIFEKQGYTLIPHLCS